MPATKKGKRSQRPKKKVKAEAAQSMKQTVTPEKCPAAPTITAESPEDVLTTLISASEEPRTISERLEEVLAAPKQTTEEKARPRLLTLKT